jgi:hypothetical protein
MAEVGEEVHDEEEAEEGIVPSLTNSGSCGRW